jgi:hypothetical protein
MRKTLLVAFGLVALGCGGGGSGTAAQPATVARPIRGAADVIGEAEINASVYQNALEVVQNLRPTMMRPRTSTAQGPVPVVLYMDDVRMGELSGLGADLTGLTNVPAGRVKEIRYINARDATTRWGTGHASGVILVTTKR